MSYHNKFHGMTFKDMTFDYMIILLHDIFDMFHDIFFHLSHM